MTSMRSARIRRVYMRRVDAPVHVGGLARNTIHIDSVATAPHKAGQRASSWTHKAIRTQADLRWYVEL